MGMAEFSRWNEGEKAYPFKKRRSGGYDWGDQAEAGGEKKKDMRSKVKRNTSNKDKEEEEEEDDDDDDDDGDDDYDDEEERAAAKNQMIRRKGRKAGGGGLLKRGSRCSRVNGRGWQCSRQTLAGYSLCEHHLGKARAKGIGRMVGIRRSAAAVSRPSRKNDDNRNEKDYDASRPLLVKEATLVEDDDEKEEEVACPLLPTMVVNKKKRARRLGWKRLDNSANTQQCEGVA